MRRLDWILGLALGGSVLLAGMSTANAADMARYAVHYPPVALSGATPAQAKEIKRGAYLTKISDCMACHTDHGPGVKKQGQPFAGGLPIKTPFGTIYSRNITPDKQTGIGNWSFKQFDDAVRYGDSPQGYLFAAMPYAYYNVMSKAQVHAIWEYLRHVPAAHRKNKAIDMPPPFRWRWLQFGWRFMFYKPTEGQLKNDPSHSAQWNRGRFIVQGPEHCGACHTPHNMLGGTEKRYFLGGSNITGFWAPNITGLATKPHSLQTIMRVFREAKGLGGGDLKGPMLDAVANSMRYMQPADMRAVAVYIQSVQSEVPSGPRPAAMADVNLAHGQQTYQADCAACHETGIGGAPRVGVASDWAALGQAPLFVLFENVWRGVSIMPPKGGCKDCSRDDVTSAVVYMLDQSKKGVAKAQPASSAGASGGIAANTVSLAVGDKIYHAHCAACHASGLAGAPRYGDAKQWATRLKLGLDKLHQNALDGIGAMPPKGGCTDCSKAQIVSAVDYIVDGSGGKAMVQKALAGKGDKQ
ncbi:MAG: c-type cytochrome [Gammaproteobacteria bacterium]